MKIQMIQIQFDKEVSTRRGLVLLMTLVLLVVVVVIAYDLTSRVENKRRMTNYVIDRQSVSYARDSAVKYALTLFADGTMPPPIARPNEPDFSDVFTMTLEQHDQYIEDFCKLYGYEWMYDIESDKEAETSQSGLWGFFSGRGDKKSDEDAVLNMETNDIKIRGPYGQRWPLVMEPIKLEIGTSQVTIEVEDENAKYPFGWTMVNDEKINREAEASFGIFCDWSNITGSELDTIYDKVDKIIEIQPFKLEFEKKTRREVVQAPQVRNTNNRTTRRTARTRYRTIQVTADEQEYDQAKMISALLNSSVSDAQVLVRPYLDSDKKTETAKKYVSFWGTHRVNINTAPRHVLEAALVFGGDEVEVAEAIILKRQEKPFENFEELKKELLIYNTNLAKCEKMITTTSDVYTIRVTAESGAVKASTVIAVKRIGKEFKQIGMIPD